MIAEPYICIKGQSLGEIDWETTNAARGSCKNVLTEMMRNAESTWRRYADFEREKLRGLSCQDIRMPGIGTIYDQTGVSVGYSIYCKNSNELYLSSELIGYSRYLCDSESSRLLKRAEFLKAVCEKEGVEWLPESKKCEEQSGTLCYCHPSSGLDCGVTKTGCPCSCHQKEEKCQCSGFCTSACSCRCHHMVLRSSKPLTETHTVEPEGKKCRKNGLTCGCVECFMDRNYCSKPEEPKPECSVEHSKMPQGFTCVCGVIQCADPKDAKPECRYISVCCDRDPCKCGKNDYGEGGLCKPKEPEKWEDPINSLQRAVMKLQQREIARIAAEALKDTKVDVEIFGKPCSLIEHNMLSDLVHAMKAEEKEFRKELLDILSHAQIAFGEDGKKLRKRFESLKKKFL